MLKQRLKDRREKAQAEAQLKEQFLVAHQTLLNYLTRYENEHKMLPSLVRQALNLFQKVSEPDPIFPMSLTVHVSERLVELAYSLQRNNMLQQAPNEQHARPNALLPHQMIGAGQHTLGFCEPINLAFIATDMMKENIIEADFVVIRGQLTQENLQAFCTGKVEIKPGGQIVITFSKGEVRHYRVFSRHVEDELTILYWCNITTTFSDPLEDDQQEKNLSVELRRAIPVFR
jgi:hypothetical protein